MLKLKLKLSDMVLKDTYIDIRIDGMGQQDILDFLLNHPDKWFTTREVTEGTGKSSNCSYSLRSLRRRGEVLTKEIIFERNGKLGFLYKHKPEEINLEKYFEALEIYLKYAFPHDEKLKSFRRKMGRREVKENDPNYPFPPEEMRFGCFINSHMKMRYSKGWGNFQSGFQVDKNNSGDSKERQIICEKIKVEIEKEWKRCGIPVYREV